MLETGSFTPLDWERFERAERAAQYCGRTTAMIVNLHLAGQAGKEDVWEQELNVWQRRCFEASQQLPQYQAALAELDSITQEEYELHIVPRTQLYY